jgi:ABC-type multidrug transport system ATPase subunit
VIELELAAARVPPLVLAPLSARLGAGVHALLGGKADGPPIVLGLVAGHVKLRQGRALVLGAAPADARVRASVAHVPLDAVLPDALRVDEALEAAALVRGRPAGSAVSRLETFGLAALAPRLGRSLSREEARAVALAEALTSSARVLLVEEPLATVDARATAAIAEGLRARAKEGACVLVATSSARDARSLADGILTFDRGTLVRHAPATDPLFLAGPQGAEVHVASADPKRLAASLSSEPDVRAVRLEADVLVVRGADVATIARAVARAATREGIALEALEPALLRGDELRAAIAGDTAGAYRAAYDRARGSGPPVTLGAGEPG